MARRGSRTTTPDAPDALLAELRPALVELLDEDRLQIRAALTDCLSGCLVVLVEVPAGTEVEWGGWQGRDEDGNWLTPDDADPPDPPAWAWRVGHVRRPLRAPSPVYVGKRAVRALLEGLDEATADGTRPGLLSDVQVTMAHAKPVHGGSDRIARLPSDWQVGLRDLRVPARGWLDYALATGLSASRREALDEVVRAAGAGGAEPTGPRAVANLYKTIGALALALADARPETLRRHHTCMPMVKPVAKAVRQALEAQRPAGTLATGSGLSESAIAGRLREGIEALALISEDGDKASR